MQPPNDEHAWFREQLSDAALAQYRDERFGAQALAIIGAELAIETDAAFIADWTAWADLHRSAKQLGYDVATTEDGISYRLYLAPANKHLALDYDHWFKQYKAQSEIPDHDEPLSGAAPA